MDPTRCPVATEHSVYRFLSYLRTNPVAFVPLLQERLDHYADLLYKPPGRNGIETSEGGSGPASAINFLEDFPLGVPEEPTYDIRLSVLARRSDVPVDELWRYVSGSENCYIYWISQSRLTLPWDGQHIVLSLLIEDGVEEKTFREIVCREPQVKKIGIGVRPPSERDEEDDEEDVNEGLIVVILTGGRARVRSDDDVEAEKLREEEEERGGRDSGYDVDSEDEDDEDEGEDEDEKDEGEIRRAASDLKDVFVAPPGSNDDATSAPTPGTGTGDSSSLGVVGPQEASSSGDDGGGRTKIRRRGRRSAKKAIPKPKKKKRVRQRRIDPNLNEFASPRTDIRLSLPMKFHDVLSRQHHRVRDIVDAHLERRMLQSTPIPIPTATPSRVVSEGEQEYQGEEKEGEGEQQQQTEEEEGEISTPPLGSSPAATDLPPLVRFGDLVVDHESRVLDFKQFPSSITFPKVLAITDRKFRQSIASKLRDYFVAFANTVGGILLFGVTDKALIVEPEIIPDDVEEVIIKQFDSLVAGSIQPQVECKDFQLLFIRVDGQYADMKLIAMVVEKGSLFYVFKEGGGFRSFQRMTERNVQLDWDTIMRNYDATPGRTERSDDLFEEGAIEEITQAFIRGDKQHQILYGTHGTGKTILARQVVSSPAIRSAFLVLWISVGYKAEDALKSEFHAFPKPADDERRLLVVLDDVTEERQFLFFLQYENVHLLVTTANEFESPHLRQYIVPVSGELGPTSLRRLEKKLKMKLRGLVRETPLTPASPDESDTEVTEPDGAELFLMQVQSQSGFSGSSAISPLSSPRAGEVQSLVRIMKDLGVNDVEDVSRTLKRKNQGVYAAAHSLQIFPQNVLVPASLLLRTRILSDSELRSLERQYIVEFAGRASEANEIRILLRFQIEDEEARQKSFLASLRRAASHNLDEASKKYRFQYLFFHLKRCSAYDEMVSLLTEDFTRWILPKYECLRSSSAVLRDFTHVNLRENPTTKCIYNVLVALSPEGWVGDLRFSLSLGLRRFRTNKFPGLEGFLNSVKSSPGPTWLFPVSLLFPAKARFKRIYMREITTASLVVKHSILIGYETGRIVVYDLVRMRLMENVLFADPHEASVTDLFVCGGSLYSSSLDRTIIEWNMRTGTRIHAFVASQALVQVCATESQVVGLGADNSLFLWSRRLSPESQECRVVPKIAKSMSWNLLTPIGDPVKELFLVKEEAIVSLDLDTLSTQGFYESGFAIWKAVIRDQILVVVPASRRSFSLYSEGQRLGEVILSEEVCCISLSRDHIYIGVTSGKILKYAMKLKYLGYHALYVKDVMLSVSVRKRDIVGVMARHFEMLRKQDIVKMPSTFRQNHLLVRGIGDRFCSMVTADSKVRMFSSSGSLLRQAEIGLGPKSLTRTLPSRVFFHDPSAGCVVSKSLDSGRVVRTYPCKLPVEFLNVSGGGLLVATTTAQTVELLSVRKSISLPNPLSHCRLIMGRGEDFFVACENNSVHLFGLDGSSKIVFLHEDLSGLRSFVLSKDGKLLLCLTSALESIVVVSIRNGIVDRRFSHECQIEALCVSPSNKHVLTSGRDHCLRIFLLETEELLMTLEIPPKYPCVFSTLEWLSHRPVIACGARDGSIVVFRVMLEDQRRAMISNIVLPPGHEDRLTLAPKRREVRPRTPSGGVTSSPNLEFLSRVQTQRWTKRNVSDWILSLDEDFSFLKYDLMFQRHHIRGENLFDLEESHLKEMGIVPIGHRLLILSRVRRLRLDDKKRQRGSRRRGRRGSVRRRRQ